MSEAMAVIERGQVAIVPAQAMSLKEITDRVNLVHNVLDKVMKKGTHYGTVPGCGSKMVLLKPGADVLAMTFRLVPQFKVERIDLDAGHREFDVTCSMFGPSGDLLGQGVGSASTMEKKYRYRWDGEGPKRKRVENEDIADVYNTVLKIAKKRAHIDATLTVTAAADLFTQDLIDEDEPPEPGFRQPTPKPQEAAPDPIDNQVEGQVEHVSEKSGTTKGKAWTRYGVKIDGTWFNTFDSAYAELARAAKDDGNQVSIVWTSGPKDSRDIVSIEPVIVYEAGDANEEELPLEG